MWFYKLMVMTYIARNASRRSIASMKKRVKRKQRNGVSGEQHPRHIERCAMA